MQALVFLSFLALTFGQGISVWTAVVMVDGTDSSALLDTINWYRTGFAFSTPIASIVGLDATLYTDPIDCGTFYDFTVTAPPSIDYDSMQGLVDYWLDPSELSCDSSATNGITCDTSYCTDNGLDLFWSYALDPATVGIACWETTEADCGTGNAWMTCSFVDDSDTMSFAYSGSLDVTSCPTCGDGIVFLADGANGYYMEDCDASNEEGCDSSDCMADTGYMCTIDANWVTVDCMPVCGDGIVTSGDSTDPEGCDAGTLNGDADIIGCTSNCQVRLGYECTNSGSADPETTGCSVIDGWNCGNNNDVDCTPICGDSVALTGYEWCDDGNTVTTVDGCASNCDVVDGWSCNVWWDQVKASECSEIMADGFITGSEECDDGNSDDGDGCESDDTVTTDGDWVCDGQPSLCNPSDWESPIGDDTIRTWIDAASLTDIATWVESSSGPAIITTAVLTLPSATSNVILASFELADPSASSSYEYSTLRTAIDDVRDYIAGVYNDACVADAQTDGTVIASEDDCRFIDALQQCVIAEVYDEPSADDGVSLDDYSPVSAKFRVVSRRASSSSALVCALAFFVAAFVALLH